MSYGQASLCTAYQPLNKDPLYLTWSPQIRLTVTAHLEVIGCYNVETLGGTLGQEPPGFIDPVTRMNQVCVGYVRTGGVEDLRKTVRTL